MLLSRNFVCSNRVLYLYLLFASLVFAAVTILIHLFIQKSNGFNLTNDNEKIVVEDLTRIKQSLRSELKALEQKRTRLIKRTRSLSAKIKSLEETFDILEKNVDLLKRNYLAKVLEENEIEHSFINDFETMKKVQLVQFEPQEKFILPRNTHKSESSHSYFSLSNSFNLTKCNLYEKLKIYIYDKSIPVDHAIRNILIDSSQVQIVQDQNEACLVLLIVSKYNKDQLESIQSSLNGIQANLFLLETSEIVDTNFSQIFDLPLFQKSLLASFNYRKSDSFLNRHRNLFLHFSTIETNPNDEIDRMKNIKNLTVSQALEYFNSLNLTEIPLSASSQRQYLISYFQRESQDESSKAFHNSIQNILKDTRLYHLNFKCERFDVNSQYTSLCFDYNQRSEFLKKSSFTFIFNSNVSNYLWSIDDTIRLIECLKYATIPILLDIDLELPLNDFIDWNQVVIRIPFERIQYLQTILLSINHGELVVRRVKAMQIYKSYFSSKATQINTLFAAVRQRLHMPPLAISSFETNEINTDKLNSMLTYPKLKYNYENDEEYLGPKERYKINSRNYQFNFTFSSYSLWNVFYHPFSFFPSTPLDPQLPTNLKFNVDINNFGAFKYSLNDKNSNKTLNMIEYLINNQTIKNDEFANVSTKFYFGGSDGGKYFGYSLSGNYYNEQFTIVILTFKRENILTSLLESYLTLPYLNQIIVVWNAVDIDPSESFLIKFQSELKSKVLRVVKSTKNSLNNRFIPFDIIKTDAILSLDDDTSLRNDEIIFAFRVWRENRDRIVGFAARFHTYNTTTKQYSYKGKHTCEYSIILTGAAFYHRFYHYMYTYVMDERIRNLVDSIRNCEDLAFNFMVSAFTRKPPLKVTTKWHFYCPLCGEANTTEASSSKPIHYEARTKCLNYFSTIYGYNPLLYSQYRADSVLFKTKIPSEKQKCFKYV